MEEDSAPIISNRKSIIIDEGVKLDFSDVLFKPRPSTLKSRSEVNLERGFKLRSGL
jgi:hypothetical protein